MGNIIGVGGVFLQFKGEQEALKLWYKQHLNLDMSEYGTGFITGEQLMLVSFERHTSQNAIINFRVNDIVSIIHELKLNNVRISCEIKEYSYGKFAQFIDPFDNTIELWEPNVQEYKKMVLNEVNEYNKKHKLD